jgi:fructokinase
MTEVRPRVLLFGELLIDRFPEGDVFGGAPFNVARHLAAFGCEPTLVTRIGLDEAGARALQVLENCGLVTHGVQLDSIYPTGTVAVRFTASSIHRFDILPNQAYDHIHPRLARIAAIAAQPELVYFGTLAQRADSHRALRHMLRATGAQRFLDVNLRPPWIHVPRLDWSLKQADIVKANDAELELMGELLDLRESSTEARAELLIRHYSLKGVLVTLGCSGAWWFDGRNWTKMPCTELEGIRDTVGAGDAFSAVFMLGLLHNWKISVTMQRANRFAGAVCGIQGAIPQHHHFYSPFIAEWFFASGEKEPFR